tara:strand:+ start:156 stop:524 length:369 start_codon:yes stop_codon:yes gene_type:complete
MVVRRAPVRSIRPLDYGMKPKQFRARKNGPKKVEPISIRPLDYGMKKQPVKVKKKFMPDRGGTSNLTPEQRNKLTELRKKQQGPRKAPRRRPLKSLKLNTPRRRVRRKLPTAMQLFAKSRRS